MLSNMETVCGYCFDFLKKRKEEEKVDEKMEREK